jgi:excisionase family DNA binding protein
MDTLYTLHEAAELTRLPYTTLRDAITTGRIAHVRIGPTGQRGVRVTMADLEDYVSTRRQPLRPIETVQAPAVPSTPPPQSIPPSLVQLRAVPRRKAT